MFAFSHEVAVVLPGPGRWTHCFSRHHDHCNSSGGIADNTGHVVVVQAQERAV